VVLLLFLLVISDQLNAFCPSSVLSGSQEDLTHGSPCFCPPDYRCGGDGVWSDTFHFRAMQEGSNWSPRFVMYGDMGLTNARSVPALQTDVQSHLYDAILHVGECQASAGATGVAALGCRGCMPPLPVERVWSYRAVSFL